MGNTEFWLNFYAIGVVITALIMLYDLRRLIRDGYIFHSDYLMDIALISLLSWLAVFYRFTVWLMDFVTYCYAWIVFKYKVWRNKKNK